MLSDHNKWRWQHKLEAAEVTAPVRPCIAATQAAQQYVLLTTCSLVQSCERFNPMQQGVESPQKKPCRNILLPQPYPHPNRFCWEAIFCVFNVTTVLRAVPETVNGVEGFQGEVPC